MQLKQIQFKKHLKLIKHPNSSLCSISSTFISDHNLSFLFNDFIHNILSKIINFTFVLAKRHGNYYICLAICQEFSSFLSYL